MNFLCCIDACRECFEKQFEGPAWKNLIEFRCNMKSLTNFDATCKRFSEPDKTFVEKCLQRGLKTVLGSSSSMFCQSTCSNNQNIDFSDSNIFN